jgi:hypothetical protein
VHVRHIPAMCAVLLSYIPIPKILMQIRL